MMSELAQYWLEILNAAGIVGGLLFTGLGFWHDQRMRRTEVILSLTESHREIWERMIEQPELARVLDPAADTVALPPTAAESRFVKLVLLHVSASLHAVRNGTYHGSSEMDEDVRSFLSLPIPRVVLEEFLPYQDEAFRHYVDTITTGK
jgi:hypothetical protein